MHAIGDDHHLLSLRPLRRRRPPEAARYSTTTLRRRRSPHIIGRVLKAAGAGPCGAGQPLGCRRSTPWALSRHCRRWSRLSSPPLSSLVYPHTRCWLLHRRYDCRVVGFRLSTQQLLQVFEFHMGPRRSTFADGGLETLSTGDKAWLHKGLRAWRPGLACAWRELLAWRWGQLATEWPSVWRGVQVRARASAE